MIDKLLAKKEELQMEGQKVANFDYKAKIEKEVAEYTEKLTAKYETERQVTLTSIRDRIALVDELLNSENEAISNEENYN